MGSSALERMFNLDDRLALFIDGANLYQSARALGFDIDYKRLLWTSLNSVASCAPTTTLRCSTSRIFPDPAVGRLARL